MRPGRRIGLWTRRDYLEEYLKERDWVLLSQYYEQNHQFEKSARILVLIASENFADWFDQSFPQQQQFQFSSPASSSLQIGQPPVSTSRPQQRQHMNFNLDFTKMELDDRISILGKAASLAKAALHELQSQPPRQPQSQATLPGSSCRICGRAIFGPASSLRFGVNPQQKRSKLQLNEFLTEIQDRIDVALVQRQVLLEFQNMWKNKLLPGDETMADLSPEEQQQQRQQRHQVVKELNSYLFNLSDLYNKYAQKYDLKESQLRIIETSSH